jgi:hypothetical protein
MSAAVCARCLMRDSANCSSVSGILTSQFVCFGSYTTFGSRIISLKVSCEARYCVIASALNGGHEDASLRCSRLQDAGLWHGACSEISRRERQHTGNSAYFCSRPSMDSLSKV